MDNDDIIFYILDILYSERDVETIKKCMIINKQWYSIIISNKNKYLKTLEMFLFLFSNDNSLQYKFFNSVLNMISDLHIHKDLNFVSRKKPKKALKYCIKLIPNENTNFLLLKNDKISESSDVVMNCLLKYIHINDNDIQNNQKIQEISRIVSIIYANFVEKNKEIVDIKIMNMTTQILLTRTINQLVKICSSINLTNIWK